MTMHVAASKWPDAAPQRPTVRHDVGCMKSAAIRANYGACGMVNVNRVSVASDFTSRRPPVGSRDLRADIKTQT
jgi:hypothetical protein